jgi:hypothetical protein
MTRVGSLGADAHENHATQLAPLRSPMALLGADAQEYRATRLAFATRVAVSA